MGEVGYLAPIGLEEALQGELKNVVARYGRLFLAEGGLQNVHWAQNIWLEPRVAPICSVQDAVAKLRSLHGLWAYYPYASVRRGELIRESLPYFSPKPLPFPNSLPQTPLGSWTLLDDKTLLCSPRSSSPFANGEVIFQETKEPPSRAYLKLWELFTRIGHWPGKGDVCLDLGASPGSWSWVLQSLGANVIAVDRAPLEISGVRFLKKDAFSICPEDFPEVKWVFSDLICYPEKLYEWIQPWLQKNVHLVCTLKFQGNKEYDIIKKFEQIEGGSLLRLFHNKHELTWYRPHER